MLLKCLLCGFRRNASLILLLGPQGLDRFFPLPKLSLLLRYALLASSDDLRCCSQVAFLSFPLSFLCLELCRDRSPLFHKLSVLGSKR